MSEKEEKISTNRKILFCISGIQNSGKTSTLKILYDQFKKLPSFSSLTTPSTNDDFSDIFTISINKNTYKVGYNTAGDIPSDIDNILKTFIKCDLIICASRSRGATKDAVENFAKNNGFELKMISKSYFKINSSTNTNNIKKEEDYLNKYFAEYLYTLISDSINGSL